ncbi:MAG: DUF2911 domain-containing protein [Bacteroidota bacterium]|jgi:hypothetical protein
MKKFITLTLLGSLLLSSTVFCQDDKSKRPSPPAKATETLKSGAVVTIDYSSPALKGRVIGKDVEPKTGVIWRAGANEATSFEASRNVTVEGKALAAGKYAFFVLTAANGDATLIFNKNYNQWGAYDYKESEDVLRVPAKVGKAANSSERLTFAISKEGRVTLQWGTMEIAFNVQ